LLLKNPEVIKSICELLLNILSGTVPVSNKEKRIFLSHRPEVDKLISKTVGNIKKQRILNSQRGSGLLTTILALALPIVAQLLSGHNG